VNEDFNARVAHAIKDHNQRIQHLETTERAEVAGSFPRYAFVDLPTGFDGAVTYVTDGRKEGEGVGAGTGVPAYWSSAGAGGAVWYKFSTDTAVLT